MTKQSGDRARSDYDALILDARARQSLAAIRSLGRHDLRVVAADTIPRVAGFTSRFCTDHIVIPTWENDPDAAIACIETFLAQHRVRVLIPAADGTIEALRRARERLRPRVALALANEAALEIAVDKEKTLAAARRLGMRILRNMILHSVDELPAALSEVGLPAVIKPTRSWAESEHGSKRVVSTLVVSQDEAARAVERLTNLGETVLFQQLLLGRRESVNFLFADGDIYARFAHYAQRMEPPLGGTSVLWQNIEIPDDTGEQAERLIRALHLDGISQVEFRRGEDDYPYLMEINPRMTADLNLAICAGIDIPYMIYQWASGQKIDRVGRYRTGLWMRYLGGDIRATFDTITKPNRPGQPRPARGAFDFCASFLKPMRYDYVDWRDPAPIFTAIRGFTRNTVAKYLFGKPPP